MNLITLEDISKHYSERQLLEGASLFINEEDRIGLIGVNGSGKTTLLHIVAGLEQPDTGMVRKWGGVRIAYLPQNPQIEGSQTILDYVFAGEAPQLRLLHDYRQASDQLEREPGNVVQQQRLASLTNEMDRTGGWAAEAGAKAILTRLGIREFYSAAATLSGGQAKRVALARVLIDPVDLLILDEPTNHIDAETITWLETHLSGFSGALLMVTHDRYFLDRVVNRIVELDRRELVNYPGNYSRYLELRTRRQEGMAAAEQKRHSLLRRELAWLRRGAMARSTKQKARKRRVEELQQLTHDRGDETVAIALAGRRLGKKVLEAKDIGKAFGPLQLFQNVDFFLSPRDRIGILGPNGAGKSTLLDILAGTTPADSGNVTWGPTVHLGYYDQLSRSLDTSQRVIDFINDKAPLIRTRDGRRVEAAKMLEWFLFPRPQQQAYISALSGGERRRLYLLWVLVHQPNVLFLDEPTNDLDIQTLTVLEQFLDHFEGCLVVASHDRYFLDRNVDFLATFEKGALSGRYPAPYEAYRQSVEKQKATRQNEIDGSARDDPSSNLNRPQESADSGRDVSKPRPRKISWKESRELESLEKRIAELEAEKTTLERAVNEVGGDYTRLQALADQLQAVEKTLDVNMVRWLELSEVGS
jgi:ATP-binding cassette subfamily F protein uup